MRPALLLVLLVLLALFGAREAAAQVLASDDLASCKTDSVRRDTEIIRSFADERTPDLPRQAVTIELGERLCFGGRIDDDGELELLTVMHGGPNQVLLSLRLTQEGSQMVLSIAQGSQRWLLFRYARVLSKLDVAMPARGQPVEPGKPGVERWEGEPHRVVVFGFRFVTPEVAGRTPPRLFAGADGKGAIIGITGWIGLAGVRLDALRGALAADGFVTPPTTYVVGGFGVEGRFGPVRVGLPLELGALSAEHRESGKETRIVIAGAGPYLGWDFLRAPGSSTFVGAGLIFGSVRIDTSLGELTLFRERLAPFGRRNEVERGFTNLLLEVGHDRYLKIANLPGTEHAALQLGGRLGYAWQLGSGDWETSDDDQHELGGGPEISTPGPRFRLILGLMVD